MKAPERNAEIVRLYRAGRKQTEIARQFGMSQPSIARIIQESIRRAKNMQISCAKPIDSLSKEL